MDDKIEVLAGKVLLVEGLLARLLVNQRQVHLLQFFGVVSGRTKWVLAVPSGDTALVTIDVAGERKADTADVTAEDERILDDQDGDVIDQLVGVVLRMEKD